MSFGFKHRGMNSLAYNINFSKAEATGIALSYII